MIPSGRQHLRLVGGKRLFFFEVCLCQGDRFEELLNLGEYVEEDQSTYLSVMMTFVFNKGTFIVG